VPQQRRDRDSNGDSLRLPPEVRSRLIDVLGAKRFTADLDNDIADTLQWHQTPSDERRWRARQDAAQRVLKAMAELRRQSARANVAFGMLTGRRFIASSWNDLLAQLAEAERTVQAWVKGRPIETRKRGAPHRGRAAIRYLLLTTLEDAGVDIDNHSGPAAQALAILLEHVDRLDGSKPRQRAELFKKRDWARWITEIRELERLRQQPSFLKSRK
jgi:hypothetical protein